MHYLTLIAVNVPQIKENEAENKKVKALIKAMETNKPEGKDYLYDIKLEELKETQTTFARKVSDLAYEFMEPFGQDSEDYQEFCDLTEELESVYESEKGNFIKTPDGRIFEEYRNIDGHNFSIENGMVYERIRTGKAGSQFKRTKIAKKMKAIMDYPYKKAYKTFDLFAREGRNESYDENQQAYGYYCNPNTVYDWCVIGGRWPNIFLVKEECQEIYISTESHGCQKDKPNGYKWVTAARMKDIEWEVMKIFDKENQTKQYHTFVEYFEKGEVPPNSYYTLTEKGLNSFGDMAYIKGESLEEFLLRKGVSDELKYPCVCYGYFHDGLYNERWIYSTPGQAGSDKNLIAWQKEVDEYLLGLNPEDVLVGIDIHI